MPLAASKLKNAVTVAVSVRVAQPGMSLAARVLVAAMASSRRRTVRGAQVDPTKRRNIP